MGSWLGLRVFLLAEAQNRAIDLYKHGPHLSLWPNCLAFFPAVIPLPLSGSVFPTNEIFPR